MGYLIDEIEAKALAELANDFAPIDDARASAAYRSLIARNLFLKTLMEISGVPIDITRLSSLEAPHAAE